MKGKGERVLMVAATPFFADRGAHIRISNEIEALHEKGFEVVLCTYHIGSEVEGITTRRIPKVSWYTKLTPGPSLGKIWLDALLTVTTIKEIKRFNPGMLHAHMYEGLLIAYVARLVTRIKAPIIFDCQGSLAEEMWAYSLEKSRFGKIGYGLCKAVERIVLNLPDRIVCSSLNSAKFIEEIYRPKRKVEVLQDAADSRLVRHLSKVSRTQAREELGIADASKVLLYTGAVSRAKGADDLLLHLPEPLAKDPNLVVVCAGYGDYMDEAKRINAELIAEKRVIFTGRFAYDTIASLLSAADIAIDPKHGSTESSGKLYNYMTAGLPVVAFQGDLALRELGDQGIFITSWDDLSAACASVGIGERVIYDSLVTWDVIIDKLIHIYAQEKL